MKSPSRRSVLSCPEGPYKQGKQLLIPVGICCLDEHGWCMEHGPDNSVGGPVERIIVQHTTGRAGKLLPTADE